MLLRWSDIPAVHQAALLNSPPIALLEAPAVARMLGVGQSTLRNWRFRDQGPLAEAAELYGRSAPSPALYRVSRILHWLGALNEPAWKLERAWLASHFDGWRFVHFSKFVDVNGQMTEQDTELVSESARNEAHHRDFNAAAGNVSWPGRQPSQRPPRKSSECTSAGQILHSDAQGASSKES